MGFDFSAFFGGLVEGAGEQVEKRNKEIRETTNNEMENLYKQAQKQNEKAQTQREKLKEYANTISSYRGKNNAGMTDAQIIGILQNPKKAEEVVKVLQKHSESGTLDTLDFNEVFKTAQGNTDRSLKDFLATAYMPQRIEQSAEQKKAEQERLRTQTAFGLTTDTAARAQKQFEQVAGKSVAQLRAEATGERVLDTGGIETEVAWDKLAKPQSNQDIKNRLRDSLAGGKGLDHPDNKKMLDQLAANSVIETRFGADKPRTASDIRSVFRDSIRAGMDPFIVKGVVRVDPQTGDFIPITGDAKSIKEFVDHKNNIIEKQARSMGLIDKNNNIVGGRDAFDALIPHANIQDGKIVSWKGGTQEEGKKEEKATPTAEPKKETAAPAKADLAKPVPIPKTKDGKIDGTKLIAGQHYTDSAGNVQIWNGMNWQPVNK